MRRIVRTARQRRDLRELNRVVRSASPSMQQELTAMWMRQISR